MKRINKDKLNALMMEQLKQKYPNMPEAYIPKTEWNDNSANALTKCVIAWIQFMGGQAERIVLPFMIIILMTSLITSRKN